MKKIISFSALIASFPFVTLAAGPVTFLTVLEDVAIILNKYVLPLLIVLAVVYFVWGVIQYTVSQDEEAKKGARGKIIQGIIGLFVIIAFWGIVFLISNTFSVGAARLNLNEVPCTPAPGYICP